MAVRVPPIMLPVKLPLRAVTSPDEAPEVFVAVRVDPLMSPVMFPLWPRTVEAPVALITDESVMSPVMFPLIP